MKLLVIAMRVSEVFEKGRKEHETASKGNACKIAIREGKQET